MTKFRVEVFLPASFIVFLLTIVSLFFAAVKDEGHINETTEPVRNFIADSFIFFRFPVHTLLESWILSAGSAWYFPGLMLNVLIWAILIERLFSLGIVMVRRIKVSDIQNR